MSTTQRRAATALHLMSTRRVQTAGDGDHSDGGGLLLRVRGASAAWVLRYTSPAGKRRELGLGRAERGSTEQAGRSLITARDLAHKARELLRHGQDPIDAKKQQREADKAAVVAKKAEASRKHWTLARAARDYHARVIEPNRKPKHAAQWIASLENHVPAALWHAPIESIEPPDLLAALQEVTPHERARNLKADTIDETVRRIRQRLDAVFEDAIFKKRCGSNVAAAVRRKMREGSKRQKKGQFAALPYKEAPAFLQRLRDQPGTAARCLEFTLLTAARTGESLGCVAAELDLVAARWDVPEERMKASGKEEPEAHVVYLPPRAVGIAQAQLALGGAYVFSSPMDDRKPMSNMAMLKVLERMGMRDQTTVHGLRATFSTWAYDTNAARPDVIEACLAHKEADKVKAAYNRAKFADERRALLAAWAAYLERQPAQVIPLLVA